MRSLEEVPVNAASVEMTSEGGEDVLVVCMFHALIPARVVEARTEQGVTDYRNIGASRGSSSVIYDFGNVGGGQEAIPGLEFFCLGEVPARVTANNVDVFDAFRDEVLKSFISARASTRRSAVTAIWYRTPAMLRAPWRELAHNSSSDRIPACGRDGLAVRAGRPSAGLRFRAFFFKFPSKSCRWTGARQFPVDLAPAHAAVARCESSELRVPVATVLTW